MSSLLDHHLRGSPQIQESIQRHISALVDAVVALQKQLCIESSKAVSATVILSGQKAQPLVRGKPVRVLTRSRYNVVKALIDAGPSGLSKDELVVKSGHTDSVNILKRLTLDPDWNSVIQLAGRTGGRYRIGLTPTNSTLF